MSARTLLRGLLAYTVLLALLCAGVSRALWLDPQHSASSVRIVSLWRAGQRIGRAVVDTDADVERVTCEAASCVRVVDRVVDSGPVPRAPLLLFAISFAAGRDGLQASIGSKTAYLTPEDLLALQASKSGARLGDKELRIGLNDPLVVLDRLASELGVEREALLRNGQLRRILVRREQAAPNVWPLPAASVADITPARLRDSISATADYLVRNQDAEGRFAYEIDALSGDDLPGYNWPRHGGAALTLAQVANALGDKAVGEAALRACRLVQSGFTLDCGEQRCIGEGSRVDAGAAALALLSYSELTLAGISDEFRDDVSALSAFLRSLQRQDGEFKHVFDRDAGRALDVQLPYYSGEVVLALARAARITESAENLRAASAGLSHLVRRSVFQNRYTYDAEHWTCQALEELWDRAPDRAALAFCVDHQAYNRQNQFDADDLLAEYEGGIASNGYAPPRIAATGARSEGAAATLAAALAAGLPTDQIEPLERQVRHAIGFMLRYQLTPGPTHLMRDPARVLGAWTGSPIDMSIRIDYPQHVAGALLRYMRRLQLQRGEDTSAAHGPAAAEDRSLR